MRLKAKLSVAIIMTGMLGLAAPANAQFQEIWDGIGFGREKEAPDYRERAPLVVPPNLSLRAPEDHSPAARESKWPKDPDVARRRAALEDSRRPRAPDSELDNADRPRLLTIDQLRSGRVAGAEVPNGGPNRSRNNNGYDIDQDEHGRINPDVLRAQGEAFRGAREPPQVPGTEPKRKYLTDPPTGIRAAAAGAPFRESREARQDADAESSPYAFFRKITGLDE